MRFMLSEHRVSGRRPLLSAYSLGLRYTILFVHLRSSYYMTGPAPFQRGYSLDRVFDFSSLSYHIVNAIS